MASQTKFYPEEVLIQKMQDGECGWLYFVQHHSPELAEEYLDYCKTKNLPVSDDSAESFMDYRERQIDEAMAQDVA